MDFSFSPQEEEFRNELASWLEDHLPEGWLTGETRTPSDSDQKHVFLREWQKKLFEGGWTGVSWPKEYGGKGATLLEEIIYSQEMARVNAPEQINLIGTGLVGPTLIQVGTENQKERYLSKILSGEEIWCQGYSEPNAGSDLAAIQTSAVKQGDKWIINGQKVWTSYAHWADKMFLLARTKSDSKKHRGITAFIIDMHQEGVITRPIHHMNGRSDWFNEVYLEDAVAYEEDIVGEVDDGWKIGLLLLSNERTALAERVFYLQQIFSSAVDMCKQINKGGKPIIEDPLIQQKLGMLYSRTRACLLNYYRNLTKRLQTGQPGPEGSLDKLNYSVVFKEVMDFIISIQGPANTLWKNNASYDHSMQELYFTTFGWAIAGGSTEIQRNIIGERILGLPRDAR